jgi:arylsulfatase A-like enzyme
LEGYTDIPADGRLTTDKVRELRHGYYACVSYIDALVGRLLDALDRQKLAENTVIVLWGDHGYHLGEQGLWTKANNYELSTRAPLILAVPGKLRSGARTDALVEFVDLYPTLTEVCGLPLPRGLEGISLLPLLDQPNRAWKTAVFSQYPRARNGSRHRGHGDIMGYAVRTNRYRYVEWRPWDSPQVVAAELYDHASDAHETLNVVGENDHAAAVKELEGILAQGWKSALPVKYRAARATATPTTGTDASPLKPGQNTRPTKSHSTPRNNKDHERDRYDL